MVLSMDSGSLIALLSLGAVVGLLAGMLGVGGGTVIVPVMLVLLSARPEIPASSVMHVALATSLATIMFTSVSSVLAHHRRRAVLWPVAFRLVPGLLIGVLAGSVVSAQLSSSVLKTIFAVFLLVIAAHLCFGGQPAPHRQLPKFLGLSVAGFVIGEISALVGIAGGTMTVPFLAWCNVAIRNAVATSAACGFPIAAGGTLGYVISGWHENLPMSTGYVYWPAVLSIASLSLLFAPLGAKLAHTLPVDVLRKVFAVFLAAIGVKMLTGA